METRTGLWIDHCRAVIIALNKHGEELTFVISKVEHLGDAPLSQALESHTRPGDDGRPGNFEDHHRLYYDAVIAVLRESESIWVFGPGEAKTELRKRLEDHNLADRLVGVETAGEMTNAQVAAKVRVHFPLRYPVMVAK